MNETIIIKTQKQLDALPDKFEVFTYIKIESEKTNILYINKKHENSHVVVRGNSHVVVRGNSHVEAWGNSHVVARENSHVEAWGNSYVEAWENSHVVAWESSHVEAWENSHVVAWESSHVEVRGNSHVEARGNSHVSGFEFAFIIVFSASVLIKKLRQQAVLRCHESPKIEHKDESVFIINVKPLNHDLQSFLDCYDLKVEDGKVILFKSVNSDTLCDFHTGNIRYEGIIECSGFKDDNNIECGYGFHLCPTPELTQTFNVGKILRCKVDLKDIVVYSKDIKKVRCRKLEVIGEYK